MTRLTGKIHVSYVDGSKILFRQSSVRTEILFLNDKKTTRGGGRMMNHDHIKTGTVRCAFMLCLAVIISFLNPVFVSAENEEKPVRDGYYENEVFQEGAKPGAVKTGYAYEYYRKLSEYTGWKYEYVYGGFSELYQMLLDGEIDLLAGLAFREERAELIGYPEAAMGNESYYLVKHEDDEAVTADPSTLNGCRIGVLDSAMVSVLNQYLADHHVKASVVT